MKINKTQFKVLAELYNEHTESKLIKNKSQINQLLILAENHPSDFKCEIYSTYPTTYKFTILRLGYIPDFFKKWGNYEI